MKVTNNFNLPEPYYKSCLHDNHPRFGWDSFSVTELMKGTREIVLNRRYWEELEMDCVDMIWTVFGTAVHSVMEGHESENELAEERVSMEVPCGEYGIRKVSGGFDLYNGDTKILTDYKTTGVFSYQMKLQEGNESDWAKQLRVYWLIRNTVFLKDWSKTQARRDRSYPQKPILNIDYDFGNVFRSDVAADMIADLSYKIQEILQYKDALEEEIPICTPDQRWERDECWAIMKTGRKSAVKRHFKKFDAEQHLQALGAGHYIEHRSGVPVKCMDYCNCADKCNFYKNYMASLEAQSEETINE